MCYQIPFYAQDSPHNKDFSACNEDSDKVGKAWDREMALQPVTVSPSSTGHVTGSHQWGGNRSAEPTPRNKAFKK